VKIQPAAELYRKLPAVDELVREPAIRSLAESCGHEVVIGSARSVLARLREEIASGRLDESAVKLALSGLSAAIEIFFASGDQCYRSHSSHESGPRSSE
jgi:hypothetical protein